MNYTVSNASILNEERNGYGRELLGDSERQSLFSRETRNRIAHLSVLETIS